VFVEHSNTEELLSKAMLPFHRLVHPTQSAAKHFILDNLSPLGFSDFSASACSSTCMYPHLKSLNRDIALTF
jgi:hypothetical protein